MAPLSLIYPPMDKPARHETYSPSRYVVAHGMLTPCLFLIINRVYESVPPKLFRECSNFNMAEPYEHYDPLGTRFHQPGMAFMSSKAGKEIRSSLLMQVAKATCATGSRRFPGTVPKNKGGTYPYLDALL